MALLYERVLCMTDTSITDCSKLLNYCATFKGTKHKFLGREE
jgi:hypothetical protein